MTRYNNNRKNNGNNGKQSLNLLPISLPAINNGKEVFESLLKVIDAEMISPEKPSEIIKKTLAKLNAYQKHMFFVKISDTRQVIENLKDIADSKVCPDKDSRHAKILTMTEKLVPVELTGRVFQTIDFINSRSNFQWLTDLKNILKHDENLLIALAMKMAEQTHVQAPNYIKALERYNQKLLKEMFS